jgi:hypothetical protein
MSLPRHQSQLPARRSQRNLRRNPRMRRKSSMASKRRVKNLYVCVSQWSSPLELPTVTCETLYFLLPVLTRVTEARESRHKAQTPTCAL